MILTYTVILYYVKKYIAQVQILRETFPKINHCIFILSRIMIDNVVIEPVEHIR
jgi:hypothetical protein